jgi:UDP-N-acetylmuramoyl-L-alanyl-D-glutamate--2,6-diaminopimelate ligase
MRNHYKPDRYNPVKTLSNILYKSGPVKISGNPHVGIADIQFDSRKVKPGTLFIAVRGTQSDGHKFIAQALASGAVAVVCEEMPEQLGKDVTYVQVKDSSLALGIIASNYYDNPTSGLILVGVTGTNGKTTIATQLYRLFTHLGYGCGLLSTIRNLILSEEIPSTHTTPDPIQINSLLRKLADAGGQYCFMEVSSHSVVQNRITGLQFAGGIFTNLTHDHLDYHKTFKDYLLAKKRFFDELPSEAFALVNKDDKNGMVMAQNTRARVLTYALKSPADFKCRILENLLEGLQLSINNQETYCRLTGEFNAYNLTAVYGAAVLLGQSPENILTYLSSVPPVEGRFETIRSSNGITAIVDYAHTPDALKNVLNTISEIRTRNEKLITVVGAGGDRDRTKRPLMAAICAEKSDLVILTSDNPRSEEPEAIIDEMKAGITADLMRKVVTVVNRREAIKTACLMAVEGDIILVAGKGHEKYQEIKGVRHHFDDKEILKELLTIIPKKPN